MSSKAKRPRVLASTAVTRARQRFNAGDWQGAFDYWQQVLTQDPTNLDALMGAALTCHKLASPRLDSGKIEELLGEPLESWKRRHLEAACAFLSAACQFHPRNADAHYNLATALHHLGRLEESEACYRHTLTLDPNRPDAMHNLGNVLAERGNRVAAEAMYDQALAIEPENPTVRYHRSFLLLARGRWAEGWREHEARYDSPTWQALHARKDLDPAKRWTGWEAGKPWPKHLLIVSEQGFGDAIMFWRFFLYPEGMGTWRLFYYPDFAATVEVQPALASLARANLPFPVVGRGEPLPEHDAWLSIMSLPAAFGPDHPWSAFPHLLPPGPPIRLPGDDRKCGVAWAGSASHLNDRARSAPLSALAPLFDLPNTAWVSLQKERTEGLSEYPVLDISHTQTDFGVTARVIAGLDVVVTVDTAVAHLAGAMGKRTILMLPARCDWRWGTEGTTTPWYPTMTLVRARTVNDWGYVVDQVQRLLEEEP